MKSVPRPGTLTQSPPVPGASLAAAEVALGELVADMGDVGFAGEA